VEITFSNDHRDSNCTADRSPTTWVLEVPAIPSGTATLTVQIRGSGVPRSDLVVTRS
jgi:hypothetical protein